MARALYMSLLMTPAAATVQPLTIWKNIKLVKKILEFISEFPEWINYNKNLEEHLERLRRKMGLLECVEADVKSELGTEHQTGKKRKREVDHWLRSVKRKALDVKKIDDDINSVSYLPRFLFHAWLGSCIEEEIQQINELQEQGKFPEGLLLDAPQDGGDPLVPNVLIGRVASEKLDEIWAHIISPRTKRIGVQGPEGVGKSAMMAVVYNRLCSYYRVYYINVPQNFSIYRLQAAIAAEMKVILPQPEGNENKRAATIYKVLQSTDGFVLILDGLTQDFFLEDVGIPMEGNGGKLILTSRSLDVCRRMYCQATVALESLTREDSESLFVEKLFLSAPLSEEIRDVAVEIVARCDGIPSRIKHMAVQLRGVTDIDEWRAFLNEMCMKSLLGADDYSASGDFVNDDNVNSGLMNSLLLLFGRLFNSSAPLSFLMSCQW